MEVELPRLNQFYLLDAGDISVWETIFESSGKFTNVKKIVINAEDSANPKFYPTIQLNFLRFFPKLEVFELYNHNFHSIERKFEFNPQLKELKLELNRIEYLPFDIFSDLEKLKVLSLKGNHLRSSLNEFLFVRNTELVILDFSLNEISEWINLPSNTKLKELNLRGNKIKKNYSASCFDFVPTGKIEFGGQ